MTALHRHLLLACFAALLPGAGISLRADPPAAPAPTGQSAAAHDFSLPVQPLALSLEHFSKISGVNTAAKAEVLAGRQAPALSGSFTPAQALERLLAGSGLEARFISPREVAIVESAPSPVAPPADGHSAAAPADAITLEPMIVEADKIARDLQQTFTSVSIVDSGLIEDFGVRDLRDSLRFMPNVGTTPANNGNTGISIRGINSEGIGAPGANLRPLAALTIDGAPQSFEGIRRGARGSWDVKQIEVLRGPQSTLQGRNALAGAINILTNDPTPWAEAAARVQGGDQDALGFAGMLSGPVAGEQLTARVAAESFKRELGIRYTGAAASAGEELDDEDYWSLRGKVLWKPAALPGLEALLTLTRVHDRPAVPAVTGDYRDRTFDTASPTNAEIRENDIDGGVLSLRFNRGTPWTIASVTARTVTDAQIWTPSTVYVRDEYRKDRDFTQDLRLEYRGDTDLKLEIVAGLFYGRLNNFVDSYVELSGVPLQDQTIDRTTENQAAYAEVRLRPLPRVSLMVGGRYDRQDHETLWDNRQTWIGEYTEMKHEAFLPRASLGYDFTPAHTLAFTVSRGYRAGFIEFNNGMPVESEYLWSYELAWRSAWLNRRLLFNATAFVYDWTDQQINTTTTTWPFTTVTSNIGKSRARGAEFELVGRPLRALTVGASLGLLSTELVEAGPDSGNEFPEAPRLTASLWTDLRLPAGFRLGLDASFKDAFFATSDLGNTETIPSRVLYNASLAWERGRWECALHVRNLFDHDYLVGRDTTGGSYVGDPRTWLLSVTCRL